MNSRAFFAVAVIFTVLQGLSEIMLPRFMGDIVNDGIMTGSMDTVYGIGVRMLVCTAGLGISGYIAFIFINIAVLRFGNDMRVGLYEKVTALRGDELNKIENGSIITRITGDVEKVISVIKVSLDLILKPAILTIGGFIMIFSINLKFGLVFLSFIVVQVIILYIFITKTSSLFMSVQSAIDRINSKLQEILHTIRLIKISNTEEFETANFDNDNKGLYDRNIRVLKIISFFNPIVMFIMNIVIVVIVIMIGYQSREDGSTIGNVMMSITYAEQILMSIMVSSNLARTISEITPSLKRIMEIEEAGENVSDSGAEKNITAVKDVPDIKSLELRKAGVTFKDDHKILDGLDFDIHSGDSIAIVGTTSGGKTTFARLLGGLLDASEGEVLLNGNDIRGYAADQLRRHIAVVSASNNAIFSGSYMDNLVLGREGIDREDVKKAASAAEIDEFISGMPYGYDSLAYSSGNTISGGQKQRLMIARALATKPDVLILDDSTSSLDYATEKKIIENIKRTYSDMALIFITEREGSIGYFDRKYVLRRGGLE